jgi:hypothetical protein
MQSMNNQSKTTQPNQEQQPKKLTPEEAKKLLEKKEALIKSGKPIKK